MSLAIDLAKSALRIGAIKLQTSNPFTWASGYRMPVYNDNRLLLSEATTRKLVAEGFAEIIKSKKIAVEVVAGTATAGIPHATTLADMLQLPLVYVRSQAKDHGMQNRLEGAPVKGRNVVLIEDLVSTGGSSVSALEAIRDADGAVDVCLSIFSYGFKKAADCFAASNATYISLLTFDVLLQVVKDNTFLSEDEIALLQKWQADPFNWGANQGFPRKV